MTAVFFLQAENGAGLIQKFYGVEKGTGEFTGIYLWDSEASIQEFQQSEPARTIPTAYKAQGRPESSFLR
jgi:hypothetical protein